MRGGKFRLSFPLSAHTWTPHFSSDTMRAYRATARGRRSQSLAVIRRDKLLRMDGENVQFTMLVVCDGNVCRSPSAQFELEKLLPEVRVESAGMRARTNTRLCAVVFDALSAWEPGGASYAQRFRSQRILDLDLTRFDLVVTATRDQRADLTRQNPQIRDRFFTLREADMILRAQAAESLTGALRSALVPGMNALRGLAPRSDAGSSPSAIADAHPFDIPDAHAARSRRHRAVIDLSLRTASSMGESLGVLLRRA